MRNVFIQFFTVETILNLTNALLVLYWTYKHFTSIGINLSSVRKELWAYEIINRMQIDQTFNIKITLASLISIQFTRLVFSLQVSKTFGPMVKILGSMLLNVSIFMLLFVALFLIFAAIGLLIFQDLDSFSTPTLTLTTLFSACLGNFDYTIFDPAQEVSPYVGYIYLTIFLLFTMIMLLNFLIAILSNTYANLNDVQIGLYLRKVLYLRQRSNYDERFSSIIYALPPLNIISFLMLPLIAYFRSPKLNDLILIFQYIPVWATAIFIFLILSVSMIPFAYGLLIFYKASNIPNKPMFGKKDLILRICDLLLFFFFGLFIIGFWICLDTINYVFRLYDSNIIYINSHDEEELEKINKNMDGIEKYKESINQGKEYTK